LLRSILDFRCNRTGNNKRHTLFACSWGREPCPGGYTTSTRVSCRSGLPGSDCLMRTRLEKAVAAAVPAMLRDSRGNAIAESKDRNEF
jgi:hypothetical protein